MRKTLALTLIAVLGVAVVGGCGGKDSSKVAAETGAKVTLPTQCDATIKAFNAYHNATSDAVNSAQKLRRTMLAFVDGALNNVSRPKVAQLVSNYNRAVSEHSTKTVIATLAAKAYTAHRSKCSLPRSVPVACRTALKRAQGLAGLHRRQALPIINGTTRESTGFAALIAGHNAGYTQLNGLLDRLTNLGHNNSSYVTKSNALLKQYDRAVTRCYAAL